MTLYDFYREARTTPSDINQHLPVLFQYASLCESVTELGTRTGVSTTAFLFAGKPLTSYDIERRPELDRLEKLAAKEGRSFRFVEADVLNVELAPTDLLFIDTMHTYTQLSMELMKHADKARKYIILHDTTTYADAPEPVEYQTARTLRNYVEGDKGIWPAVEEFLAKHPEWTIEQRFTNNNGLTILKRTA